MGSLSVGELSELELENALVEAADRINTASSTDQLIIGLENADGLLAQVRQRPPNATLNALLPLMKAIVTEELLRNADLNAQVTLASCFSEFARISAPDPTYGDSIMKEIFRIVMVSLRQLSSESARNYLRALGILKTVEEVNLPLMLLDIGPVELIPEMFQIFLDSIRPTHPPEVFKSMETIMTAVIRESESISISFEMLRPLLCSVRMENKIASPSSWKLGVKVFEKCSMELKHPLKQVVISKNLYVYDYAGIVSSLCQNKLNKASDKLESPAANSNEDSDGGENNDIAQSKKDVGAPSIQKGGKPSKVKHLESSSTSKQKKMQDKMKGSSDSKKTCKRGHAGSEEDIGKTMSQKHVTEDVSNQKADTNPGTVELKRKKNKTNKLKKSYAEELINARIKVWWPMDRCFYRGTVVEFDPAPAVKKHKILYDDGEVEILNLRTEVWEFVDEVPPQKQEKDQTSLKKAVSRSEEETVAMKKKTHLKKQHATSSSKGSKNEGHAMGKPGNMSTSEEKITMIEADEDATNP